MAEICAAQAAAGEIGNSKIERLAAKIDDRRANRVKIPFELRVYFLEVCGDIAKKSGLDNRISLDDFHELRDEVHTRIIRSSKSSPSKVTRIIKEEVLGIWDRDETMLRLLDRAHEVIQEVDAHWFWFRDFNFYFTQVVPRRSWLRNPTLVAMELLFLFYVVSAVVFCTIMQDEVVCPRDPSGEDRFYYGWMSSIYFASATMSTVGYGDLSLGGREWWRELIGCLYMVIAVLVGYTVFMTAAESAISTVSSSSGLDKVSQFSEMSVKSILKKDEKDFPLYVQIRMILCLRIAQLALLFISYNLVGVVIARLFLLTTDEPAEQWSWMTTIYWSIQTTSTIGYGDLSMPLQLQWFQIVYCTFGTALVGSVIGGVANLKKDLQDLRKRFAWKRLEVSKRLVDDLKGPSKDHDRKINEYEFMVGSLLLLDKIKKGDIEMIMEKFGQLADGDEFISFKAATATARQSNVFDLEGEVHDDEANDKSMFFQL